MTETPIPPSTQFFQIYYQPKQVSFLDPVAHPYDNCQNRNPEWCEYHIFRSEYQQNTHQNADLTGFVSWKFQEKTGLSGDDFLRFIQQNPGADVYLINPFPLEALKHQNIWLQGEKTHRDLLPLVQGLFQKLCETPINLNTLHMAHTDMAFCNYWVGNTTFWDRYMAFCEPFYHYLTNETNELTPAEAAILKRKATRHNETQYAPYIMERMLSTLITLEKQSPAPQTLPALRVAIYPWSPEAIAQRLTRSTPEIISRLLTLRAAYEKSPTPYKQKLLYHLTKLIQQDKHSSNSLERGLDALESVFSSSSKHPPDSISHVMAKLRVFQAVGFSAGT
jgi:hypothetical protein